jgi:hypothetical protein
MIKVLVNVNKPPNCSYQPKESEKKTKQIKTKHLESNQYCYETAYC